MRLATIDLGTNTVRLLIADVEGAAVWRVTHQEQLVTRLGEGVACSGRLGEAPMARTATTVQRYVERARALGAQAIRIVGTSAMREAANGDAFVQVLEHATGERVEVVSGEDEARLTVRGVLDGLGHPRGSVLVFDIGGGSTEYTLVRDGILVATISLKLGVVPLTERFPFPGPVETDRYDEMSRSIAAQIRRELPDEIAGATVEHLIGTAGTVTTLAALDLGLTSYDPHRVNRHRLDRSAIARLRERLGALSVAERAQLPCLERGRADVIIPGVAIVVATMDRLRVDELIVSDAGLREGMMADTVARLAKL